jgi:UDP-N-acetylbacillosamine N-acetyltransferase
MNKAIFILGAGGHARSLITLLEHCGYTILGIFDNSYNVTKKELIGIYHLVGLEKDIIPDTRLALSIGDCIKRKNYYRKYKDQIITENLIHTTSFIEKYTNLGYSNQILANVYINSFTTIGNNNLINSGCVIEHEAIIGDHNHISVNSTLCGRVKIGSRCFIGAGSVVTDKVKICDDVIIGANSTVIKDINEKGTYVGSPVRKL